MICELRVLQDKVSEWYFLFAIAHKVTIGFAVIGVINGVFMQAWPPRGVGAR